jgi:hypothetical protein
VDFGDREATHKAENWRRFLEAGKRSLQLRLNTITIRFNPIQTNTAP